MKSQMPTVPVVARYVYLMSGKALTWKQSHVLSMFQLSECHFLYTSKNYCNMKPLKTYIPNRKVNHLNQTSIFWVHIKLQYPVCITLKFHKLKLKPDNLEAQMMKVGSPFAGSGEDRSIHVPMKPCKARRFGKERNGATICFGFSFVCSDIFKSIFFSTKSI